MGRPNKLTKLEKLDTVTGIIAGPFSAVPIIKGPAPADLRRGTRDESTSLTNTPGDTNLYLSTDIGIFSSRT
jgi:hypothetical protein